MDSDPKIFAVGDVVAGRYRILRFVAAGGAGEVYEAEDAELGERVALKTVHRKRSTDTVAVERFKREISLARQVTHPNVCRIYELGLHRQPEGDVLFLTMEMLAGETLYERIRRSGPLATDELAPLLRQMAAGLDAAHRAGVVHRDFKSGNVMLVPSEQEEGGVRAVITDFGLARHADFDSRVTAHDHLVGTPAYMAPEQLRGSMVTAAADVYAFGVVVYEALTGQTPFGAEDGLGSALQRLVKPPSSPRLHRPDLDRRWERGVLRCLAREPDGRFATAGDAADALVGEGAPFPRPLTLVAVAAGLAGLVLALWLLLADRGRDSEVTGIASSVAVPAPVGGAGSSEGLVEMRPGVALLGFRNLSSRADTAWLSPALTEMLAMEVAAGDRLRVVPGDLVARVRSELALGDLEELTGTALARAGDLVGARLVVLGSYLVAGDGGEREIRLDVQVREADSGRTVARITERGRETRILDLVEGVGGDLRQALGVGAISADEARQVKASLPAGVDSARLYAEGLASLRLHDARRALELLEEAARLDPGNALIQSGLSAAWATLGYRPRAQAAAERAFELSGSLGRRDRMWVEARYEDVSGDRTAAAESYRRLWDYFPDNLEVGLRLARAQTRLGEADAALATLAQLRRLPVGGGAAPRLDLAEASAARALSQYERQLEMATAAAASAEALGARQLVARAREVQGGAYRDLGEPDRARAAYAEARRIYEASGDRGAVARQLIAIAKIDRYQGRFDRARTAIEEALEVAREIGDQGSMRHALNTLAIIFRQQGRLQEALEMHELELAADREIGEPRSVQVALTSVGVVESDLGRLAAAEARFREALELGRASGNERSIAINLNMLGKVLLDRGELAAARQHFEQALVHNRNTRSPRGRAYYLANLAAVDFEEDDLDAARERLEEVLRIRRDLGETTNVAFSLLSLAELELASGQPEAAATAVSAATETFADQGKDDEVGLARATRARVDLARGDIEAARREAAAAGRLLAESESPDLRLRVALVGAEVELAAGERVAAQERAEAVGSEARELGMVPLEIAAEMIAARAANATAGGSRLSRARERAADLGLAGLARRHDSAPAQP